MRLAYTLHCLRAFRGGYAPLSFDEFEFVYVAADMGLVFHLWRAA